MAYPLALGLGWVLAFGALLLSARALVAADEGLRMLADEELPVLAQGAALQASLARLVASGAEPGLLTPARAAVASAATGFGDALVAAGLPAVTAADLDARVAALTADQPAAGRQRLITAGTALIDAVEAALTQVLVNAAARRDGTIARLDHHQTLLLLVAPLVLISALLTWLSLRRALFAPLRGPRAALADARTGRPAVFPPARGDEVGAIIEAVRDLSAALAERERQLRTAGACAKPAKGQSPAHLSHELRTPLHVILGYADLIRQAPGLDADTRERAGIIRRSGAHLLQLINDRLDVPTDEVGRVRPVPMEFALRGRLADLGATDGRAGARGGDICGYVGTRLRLLVVDDSGTQRLLLEHLLGELGFLVDLADGAAAALARAAAVPPDLVLMDLVMPDTSGYAVTHDLRAALGRPTLPVIALSATPVGSDADARALGFNACLLKPVERDLLLAAIGDCLGLDWLRRPADCGGLRPEDPLSCPTGPGLPNPYPTAGAAADELEAPLGGEIETIAELVRAEDWQSAADWCDDLAAGQPELAPFAGRVRSLVATRDRTALLGWLERLH